ncbi:hypothetical protein M9H77_03293 [Catharanthus roseus]|uniref:Uncharacterized protein n=1 Tax=Catharanthus roseus TaxID=4058 RepID=A0ACC0CB01_CATRO|nr:hypothetical protein M9H77_03293 [Catharanthus roseus]
MGYTWANSLWQRMEAIGREEMVYSKLGIARFNYYTDGDYGGNAYGGSHHRDGHFTHRSQIDSLCVKKFMRQNMENEGKMDYYSYDIISFPPAPSHSYFGHFFKETKSCSFVLDLDRNSLQHACTLTSMSGRRHTMEFEGQGENIGGKLFLCYGDSSTSFSSNLFLFYLVFSFKDLKLFFDGYAKLEKSVFDPKYWHDNLDIISFVIDLFSSWTPMWGLIPSYFLDPFVENFLVKKVEGYLCSLIGDLLNKSIRRDIERCSYMIPFFETFVIALNGIAPFENHFLNVKGQLENTLHDHKIRPFTFTFQVLLEIVHSIPPLVKIISIIARRLWLFEGTDSRMRPFKGGMDGMTRDKYENMERFQGSFTRSRARKIEEKTQRIKLGRVSSYKI